MRLTVEVDHCFYPVELAEAPDREQMAAAACTQILETMKKAKASHSRFFDVKFPDGEVMKFAEIQFDKFQRLPEDFPRQAVKWYPS